MQEIFRKIADEGGKALIVGGWVRDKLLDVYSKDIDVEVYGIPEQELGSVLQKCFGTSIHKKTTEVGKSFSVFKMDNFDFSLPRTEKKTSKGHTGFETVPDHTLDYKTASKRRDFTVNSMGFDPLTGELHDAWGGESDIQKMILRHTSDAFSEDPLRCLRAFQFISRFNFEPNKYTVELCRSLSSEFNDLSKERILEEFRKWSYGDFPDKALKFLWDCRWTNCMPTIGDMVRCPQDPVVHPEGDVYTHTALTCKRIATKYNFEGDDRFTIMLAALLYNCGKPAAIVYADNNPVRGQVTFPDHEVVGSIKAESFLEDLRCDYDRVHQVVELIKNHVYPWQGANCFKKARVLLHKRNRYKTIRFLWPLIEASSSSRPPHPEGIPDAAKELMDFCKEEVLINPSSSCLILGRDLIAKGYKPSKALGQEKNRLYDLQIEHGYSRPELLKMIKDPA